MKPTTKNNLIKTAIVVFLAWAGAFIRGGNYKQLFKCGVEPFNIPSKLIFAVLFGVCAYLTMPVWHYGVAMAVAMLIGQAPALFNNVTDKYIAGRQYAKWFAVVAARGLVWLAPIVCVSAYYNGLESLYFAFLALAMPLCYIGVWVKPFGNKWFNNWTVAEILFMACISLVLVLN